MTRQDPIPLTIPTEKYIPAVIDNVIRLKKTAVPQELLSQLRNELTRENPAYHQMAALRAAQPHKYRYTKMPPSTICSIGDSDSSIFIPRGFRRRLIQLANEHGKLLKFHDKTISFKRNTDIIFNGNITLKDYQRQALSKLALGREGALVAPCGAGKTVIGISLMCAIAQPTLVLVHTTDLMQQWHRELAALCTMPTQAGQWGGGVKRRETVTVATIQTLVKMQPDDLREFLDHFGCVILDECHHCPADTFLAIINFCRARYRFGLTATPKRKDKLEFLMTDVIGPILLEIDDDELVKEGRSQQCDVTEIYTATYTKHTARDWTKLIKALIEDESRNRLIVNTAVSCWENGDQQLILSDRVSHCHELYKLLSRTGMNVQLLVGSVSKTVREKIIQDAKQGLVDAIIATKVADEGLDIETLSVIHLTCPTEHESLLKQRIGRIRRPVEGKVSVVYDYIDSRVPACLRMALNRRRLYKRWGFSITK